MKIVAMFSGCKIRNLFIIVLLISCKISGQPIIKKAKFKNLKVSHQQKNYDMIYIKHDSLMFKVSRKHLTDFDISMSDTLEISKLNNPARWAFIGLLSELLIKRKACLMTLNGAYIKQNLYCIYYFDKKLIFADFYILRETPYEGDIPFLRFTKYNVSLPNRLSND